jgi:hypothetical protein
MPKAAKDITKVPYEVTLRLFNTKRDATNFVLEPWGEVYVFSPGDELEVRMKAPEPGVPEVDVTDEALTVFGWAGSTASLFKNGEELGAGSYERTPVPTIVS